MINISVNNYYLFLYKYFCKANSDAAAIDLQRLDRMNFFNIYIIYVNNHWHKERISNLYFHMKVYRANLCSLKYEIFIPYL